MKMPTQRELLDAANKTPASRTTREQQIVDKAIRVGNQTVSNANRKSEDTQRILGL